jgi:hypothetical protein
VVTLTTRALGGLCAALRIDAVSHAVNIAARVAGCDIAISGDDPIPISTVCICDPNYRRTTSDVHGLLTPSDQKLNSGVGWGSLHSQVVYSAAAQAARAKDR